MFRIDPHDQKKVEVTDEDPHFDLSPHGPFTL